MKNGPYEIVRAPREYPGKKYRGVYCYEHHLVYWRHTGLIPKFGQEVIHHINHEKRDNRITNLELLPMSTHSSNHHKKTQDVYVFLCDCCNKIGQLPYRNYKWKTKNGQTEFFCSHRCVGLFGYGSK